MLKLPFAESNGLPHSERGQEKGKILPVQKYKDSFAFRCWFRFSVLASNMVSNIANPKPEFRFQHDLAGVKAAMRAARAGKFRKALRIADGKIFLSCYRNCACLQMSKMAASFGDRHFAFAFAERINEIAARDKSYAGIAIAFADSGRVSFALEAAKSIFEGRLRMETYSQVYSFACKTKDLERQGRDAEAWKLALDLAHKGPIHHHSCAYLVARLIKDAELRTNTYLAIEGIRAHSLGRDIRHDSACNSLLRP